MLKLLPCHGLHQLFHLNISLAQQSTLWYTFQSAYHPKHSTETALLHVLNDLLIASGAGCISILTLLDQSVAFNTIDHSILLTHLESTFGILDLALCFLRSYLQDRTQVVTE